MGGCPALRERAGCWWGREVLDIGVSFHIRILLIHQRHLFAVNLKPLFIDSRMESLKASRYVKSCYGGDGYEDAYTKCMM